MSYKSIDTSSSNFVEPGAPSSQLFRSISGNEYVHATQSIEETFVMAQQYSETNHVSLQDAYSAVLPGYDELKWKAVALQPDCVVGDVIVSDKISICCNSLLNDRLYNDTIIVAKGRNGIESATYQNMYTSYMTHSGDEHTEYGLRHTVSFGPNFEVGYMISAPWNKEKAERIEVLNITNPILEIRTEDDVLRRYIIAQDYMSGGDHTACANVKIVHEHGKWKVTMIRQFVHGFADNTARMVRELF